MRNDGFSERIKVTVYITCHNYGRYLVQAVESVRQQSMSSWELFIVDDGSGDDTHAIAGQYAECDSRVTRLRHEEARGLRACANEVLERARGEYIIRLDGDDYFDENALLVLSHYLDQHPDVGLVYPNWTYVWEDGTVIAIERRKKLGVEARVLDLPAHGACTMVRRRVLKSVGGYDTAHDSQDGHELWLKVLHRYGAGNVSTPLFFYRQHGASMSRNETRLLSSRRQIKRTLARRNQGAVKPRVVGLIPAKNTYEDMPNVVLEPIAGKSLIDHTIDVARRSEVLDEIFVYTDDERVVEHCAEIQPPVIAELREPALSAGNSTLTEVLDAAVQSLERQHDVYPDIIVLLSVHAPLRKAGHIQEAIDTLSLYDVDNVISTYGDLELHFRHGETGLEPLNPGAVSRLRLERESLYVDNGAVHALWRDFVGRGDLYQGRVGHIMMAREESYQIKSPADWELVEFLLEKKLETG